MIGLQVEPLLAADAQRKEVGIERRVGGQRQHPAGIDLEDGNGPLRLTQDLLDLFLELAVKGRIEAAALARGALGQHGNDRALLADDLQPAARLTGQVGLAPALQSQPPHHFIAAVALESPLVDLFAGNGADQADHVGRNDLVTIGTRPGLAQLDTGHGGQGVVMQLRDLGADLAQRHVPVGASVGVA